MNINMVFDKSWFQQHQRKLLWLLNTPVIKIWFRWVMRIRKYDLPLKTKIFEFGQNYFKHSVRYEGDKEIGSISFRSNEKYARRLWFAFEPLWWVFHAWDMVTKPWPALNLGWDSLPTKYSTPGSTVSGRTRRSGVDESLATIRAGAGTASSYDGGASSGIFAFLQATTTASQYSFLYRGIFLFDASALPDDVTVSAANIGLYSGSADLFVGLGAFEVDIVSSTPASDTVLANGDYANLGATPFSSVSSASLGTDAYVSFALNASGLANISKTGISKFGIRINWDTDNSAPWISGTWSGAGFTDGGYAGTTRDPKIDITYIRIFVDPANAYADDGNYATAAPDVSGDVDIQLSWDGGATWTSALTKAFGAGETTETYGNGSTELWGRTWTGDDIDDTSLRLKITAGNCYQIYKDFGFAITPARILTGIEVAVKGFWTSGSSTTSINHIKIKIYYGTSIIPISAGSQAYATDGRKNGEGAGVGTGVLVFSDSQNKWIACDNGQEVQA